MIDSKDKYRCSGCSACVQKCPNHCINLKEDNEGFLYPHVNKKHCNKCGLCNKVCPFQHETNVIEPVLVLAAYNKDEKIRFQSSSGGIFSIMAEQTINDGGVVFGARFNDQWEVILDYTETLEGIAVFRGSKYVQAYVGNTYQKCEAFLKAGRQVLFSGTPCQIAGLKRFLSKEYSNLLTVDVVCHGVPSPMVWRKYLSETITNKLELKESSVDYLSQIKNIQFRDKISGWKDYHFTVQYGRETFREKSEDNVFMNAFIADLIVRPSCFLCPFRGVNHRISDLSIADFWGVEKVMPDMDDDKGTSLLFCNTTKGLDFIDFTKINSKSVDIRKVVEWNGGLQDQLVYNSRRAHFFKNMQNSTQVTQQMLIHLLPQWQYDEAITPFWIKIVRRFRHRVIFFNK